jgi:hypothetical protein
VLSLRWIRESNGMRALTPLADTEVT